MYFYSILLYYYYNDVAKLFLINILLWMKSMLFVFTSDEQKNLYLESLRSPNIEYLIKIVLA